jgi:hypothetical protein
MPPVLLLALVAAGIAGYRIWASMADHSRASRRSAERVRRGAEPVRDLGSLEWDEAAGVYRPRTRRER